MVFTTIESIDYSGTWRVAQHDDSLAEFSRDRLFTSVYDSCKHRESAINDATWLTDTIITKLTKSLGSAFLTRDLIASITYETLARFDKVAAVYYRAFHKI